MCVPNRQFSYTPAYGPTENYEEAQGSYWDKALP